MYSKKFRAFGTPLLALILSISTLAQSSGVAMIDKTCQPCEDFYKYANGGWLKNNTIPATDSMWSRSSEIDKRTRLIVRGILEESAKKTTAPKGSDEQLIGAYYAACSNEAKIEADGAKALAPRLGRIEKIKNLREVQKEIAILHNQGIPALFNFSAGADIKNSTMVIGGISQGGLSLPNRDYYTDQKFASVREDFVKYAARLFELYGENAAQADTDARTIVDLQTKLAESSRTPLQLRDSNASYNKRTTAQLKELTPAFDWASYFEARNAPPMAEINVGQPEFFGKMNQLLSSVSIEDWKTYLRWQVYNNVAMRLSSPFTGAYFDFYGRKLTGQKEQPERWKRCAAATDATLGGALGPIYVKKAFTPEAKARMQELIRNLLAATRERLSTVEWMSDETRRESLAKLDALKQKIGYPDKWDTYPGLQLKPDAYLDNTFAVSSFAAAKNLAKIGKPVDRAEWLMTVPTFNAYYYAANNEIVFPAGFLQPPMFDPKADDAANYGAIGAVIGHEITHGFDDKGSTFDAAGNLRNWWTDFDRKNFTNRAECIEKQYSAFEVEKGLFINGKLTLGENIGDMGGLNMAYAAYRKSLAGKPKPPVIDGFTAEQRFFISYANAYAALARPEFERLLINNDTHSLSRFRVNGPLSNMPEFAEAFSCKLGDKMVRPASERCRVW